MSWSERQLAMLREMGITLWWPGAAGPAPARAPKEAAVVEAAQPPAVQAEARPAAEPPPRAPAPRPAPAAPPMAVATPMAINPVRAADLDWPQLRAAVAGCTACSLCESRTQTVFGVGNEQADWMIIGEAPGEQEDRQGEPFVGKSGQLLDRMLATVGLTRGEAEPARQVFIANTLKCRPPGNRNPTPEEMVKCEPYLLRQVALVQPRIILLMGRFAVQSILRTTEPIGKLRGRVHTYAGVPVIVTYHPAYLLRNPIDKALAWDDLCLAREVIGMAPLA
ncbi:MAG: uracil-DNA glycosylase [Aquabacterium sp.]|nr:MAG: uracil-DNA glycosylase [Aquabacterium sp.]